MEKVDERDSTIINNFQLTSRCLLAEYLTQRILTTAVPLTGTGRGKSAMRKLAAKRSTLASPTVGLSSAVLGGGQVSGSWMEVGKIYRECDAGIFGSILSIEEGVTNSVCVWDGTGSIPRYDLVRLY